MFFYYFTEVSDTVKIYGGSNKIGISNTKQAGISKIRIPYTAEEITPELVSKVLGNVLSIHSANAEKIDKYLKIVDGTEQDIDNKTRKVESRAEHNNKIKDNHAYAIVNFKEGFLLGEKREFTQKSDTNSDDLTYFDRYLTDVSFYGEDVKVKHNIYSTGLGIDFVQPRTDIFKSINGDITKQRYKTKDEGYDIETDSPFVYQSLDCRNNGIVYTSKIGVKGLGDLFDYSLVEEYDKNDIARVVVIVYTREWTAKFETDGKLIANSLLPTPPSYKELPMTPHSINEAQEGIVEVVVDLLNMVNVLASNSADNIVDKVNSVIAFKGCDFGTLEDNEIAQKISAMLRGGAIILPSNELHEASADVLSIDLKLSEVNQTAEQYLTDIYKLVGVPLATANVTSGGDTGQARLLGAGWTNAYTIIQRDILFMEQGDREVLRKMIVICKANAESKINDINVNQIDIKYSVNLSDNLLAKTQAMQNLYAINVPKTHILKVLNLWGDTKTVAEDWAKADEEAKAKAEEETNNSDEISVTDDLDNKVVSAMNDTSQRSDNKQTQSDREVTTKNATE